jgi:hypothetical protein
MQHAGLKVIVDAQVHVNDVERLRQEVRRASSQRSFPRSRRGVRRENDDRDVSLRRNPGLEQIEDGAAIEARHVQIEQNQVGLGFEDQGQEISRVGDCRGVAIPLSL